MARTTRIDAINEVLTLVGINTVADLSDPVRQDVIAAEQTMDEMLRHIAAQSNFYNTYEKVTLTPDSNGYIYAPTDVYNVQLVSHPYDQVLIKGDRVYNLTEKTFVFSGPTEFEVEYYLEFSDLPEQVVRYLIAATARKLYFKLFGPSANLQVLAADEKMAYDLWQRWEYDQGDYNMLAHPDTLRTWYTPRRAGRNSRR